MLIDQPDSLKASRAAFSAWKRMMCETLTPDWRARLIPLAEIACARTGAQPWPSVGPFCFWFRSILPITLCSAKSTACSVASSGICPLTSDRSTDAMYVSMLGPSFNWARVPLTLDTESDAASEFRTCL